MSALDSRSPKALPSRAALDGRLLQVVGVQVILALVAVGAAWVLHASRSVEPIVLLVVATAWIGVHAVAIVGVWKGCAWSRFAAAATCVPVLAVCVAAGVADLRAGEFSYLPTLQMLLLSLHVVRTLGADTGRALEERRRLLAAQAVGLAAR